MSIGRNIGIIFTFLCMSFFAVAQSGFSLQIKSSDTASDKSFNETIKQIHYNKTFTNDIQRTKEIQSFLFKLYDNGYIAASFDSIIKDSLNMTAFLNLGMVYHWAKLDKGNVDEGVLSEVGYRDKLSAGKLFNQNQVRNLEEKILNYYENNGYPFASIKLDSITFEHDKIHAKLVITKNMMVLVDSVLIKGNAELSSQYLYNYLGIKLGDPYNEALVLKIPDRLRELPFLNITQSFKVIFLEKNCKILLYIDNKKASQFDGVVGIVPNSNAPAVTGGNPTVSKVQATGEAHLRLNNSYGKGELFDLKWQEPQPQTQDLKVQFNYPFIFKSPFGLDFKFSLFKQDTSYLNLDENLGLQYLLSGGNFLKVFYEHTSSTIISARGLDSITVLPSFADIATNHYGLGYRSEKLDYRLNPRKGYTFEASASIGIKTIHKNSQINAEVYDSLHMVSNEYRAEYTFDYYFPLSQRNVIDIGAKGGYINTRDLFQNEIFRFGGLKTLRGFDEQSIYASNFEIWKIEYRYLMEQNSFLFIFYNQAWYQNKMRNYSGINTDTPYGFGVGSTFQTKLGIMSISYALGSQFNSPIEFKSGKISFGLVNYF